MYFVEDWGGAVTRFPGTLGHRIEQRFSECQRSCQCPANGLSAGPLLYRSILALQFMHAGGVARQTMHNAMRAVGCASPSVRGTRVIGGIARTQTCPFERGRKLACSFCALRAFIRCHRLRGALGEKVAESQKIKCVAQSAEQCFTLSLVRVSV